MKVLVYYDFTPEQIESLRAVSPGAEVLHATSEEEALRLVPETTALLGRFPRRCLRRRGGCGGSNRSARGWTTSSTRR
jgi:hypothetical protein